MLFVHFVALAGLLAQLEQARQALAKGDFAAARTAATQALSRNAGSAEAEIILGLADTADGHIASAEKHFFRAVSLKPADYRAHTYLGSTYLRQQRLPEAKVSFSRVIQLNAGNMVAQYNLGVIAAMQGNPAAALPYFSAVHQSNPSDAAALIALLECQLNLKQIRAARVSAQKLDKLLPSDSPALLQVGTALVARGEHEAALPFLRRFVSANPASSDAATYNLLGTVEEKRGNQKEALRSFEQAVRLAPGNEDFHVDYAGSLVNADLLDQAVAAFSEGIARLPQSMRLRLGLGSALYLAGKYEEAAQATLECVRINPKFAPAFDLLGRMFESAPERQEEIFTAFRAYLEADPADAAAHSHYGIMLFGRDRPVEARKHLQRALVVNPRLPEAHVQLGVISQAEGNLTDAIASYQRAIAIAPTYAAARYRLGLAYQKLGQTAKAQVELEAFRKLKSTESEREKNNIVQSVGAK